MAFTVNGHVCLLYTIKPFVEESELFPGFKQLQIAEKLFSPGNTENAQSTQEGEGLSQCNKNTRESINPSPLVRSEFFCRCFKMFGPSDGNFLPICLLSSPFVSLSTSVFWCSREKKYPL